MKKFFKNYGINNIIILIAFIILIFIGLIGIVRNTYSIVVSTGKVMIQEFEENNNKFELFNILEAGIVQFEIQISEYVGNRNMYIDIYGYIQNKLNNNIIIASDSKDNLYKLDNGQITFQYEEMDMDTAVNNISELNEVLLENDIPLLYVQTPFKINKYDNLLPDGIEDTTNLLTDEFLSTLQNEDIDILDLREEIYIDGLDYNELFFTTDHHWKYTTALYATEKIEEKLFLNYDMNYNSYYNNIENYYSVVDETEFLGSQGKRIGKYYAGTDELEILYPKFDTNLEIINMELISGYPNYEYEANYKTGTFEECIIDEEIKSDTSIYAEKYYTYLSTDMSERYITNNIESEGNILIIHDSFGVPVTSFMCLNYNKVTCLDIRMMKNETLIEFLEDKTFDVVIIMYNATVFENELVFEF